MLFTCLVFVLTKRPNSKRSSSVMAADHESSNEGQSRSEVGKVKASTFIFAVTAASVIGGFGLALGRVKKKNPTEFNEFAANKLALKALGYGTILSICGCGMLVITVKWALGIKNVSIIFNVKSVLNELSSYSIFWFSLLIPRPT